jgi:hypothetical protein
MTVNIEVLNIYPYLVCKIRLSIILNKIHGPKTLNFNENLDNIDKPIEKTQNICTMDRFSQERSMKHFENHTFTMWKKSPRQPNHYFDQYQLFENSPRQAYLMHDFVQQN